MNICIVGVGYVGLVTGVSLSEIGHNVCCVDTDISKIKMLNNGICPIHEVGVDNLLNKNHKKGTLGFTTNHKEAFNKSDVIVIAVGTPQRDDGSANLDYVHSVALEIANTIKQTTLVVIKSTVPMGTNDEIEKLINDNLKYDVKVEVASNPEFLSQGTALMDTFNASRIIIGVKSSWAKDILETIYKPFGLPIVVTDRKSSEMIKYASNNFLALKISFMNDIANLCEIVGANIDEVANGISYDKRIGKSFLKAGIGYGGSCFPKDTKALYWIANNYNYELKTVKAAIEVNESQKMKLAEKASKIIHSFKNKKIAILGLTFKPKTDDIRNAPSIDNIYYLLQKGAKICAYDPVGIENSKKIFANKIEYSATFEHAIENADAAFIFTEWEQISNQNLKTYKKLMHTPIIFDGRNCYAKEVANKLNINYYPIGK